MEKSGTQRQESIGGKTDASAFQVEGSLQEMVRIQAHPSAKEEEASRKNLHSWKAASCRA